MIGELSGKSHDSLKAGRLANGAARRRAGRHGGRAEMKGAPRCVYQVVSTWLREAEQLAGLDPQGGSLWHAYRRLWASARKELPDVDVAQAGGWSSLSALKMAYQKPDDQTMLRVVTHSAELREVR
ncbi:MAG TPA: hypothetical protein VJ982_11250, partial [Gemmatimonadota bacterium]|nr:hypothetical protein [Gemmatimonadota bacterium]